MFRQLTLALGVMITRVKCGRRLRYRDRADRFRHVATDRRPLLKPSSVDDFIVANPPPPTMGTIGNDVYLDSAGNYTYLHTVTPALNNNQLFNTGFSAAGFTGIAGFSFGDTTSAGGAGAASFLITEVLGQLSWYTQFPSLATPDGWDSMETIRFFFVSTNPPDIGDYNLSTTEVGTGQSYAPLAAVPEPGSIALLASGLVGLYAARRRRKSLGA